MQHSKEITIGDKKITIKELTVRQIIDISRNFSKDKIGGEPGEDKDDATTFAYILKEVQANMALTIEGITLEELMDLYPSDLKELYKVFKEVNGAFLDAADQMGILDILKQMRDAMRRDFIALRVNSLNPVISKQ